MGKFVYRAYSPRGVLEERTVRGDTAGLVNRDLSERGYRVVALRPAKSGWRWIYRQMATFLRVGVPITDAIKLLRDGTKSGPFKAALDDINDDIDDGEAFSVAVSQHPNVFNQLYVDMVRAAEYSGNLDKVLVQVATYLQRQDSAIKKLRSAMFYPAVILTLAVGVCTVLIVVVLPN